MGNGIVHVVTRLNVGGVTNQVLMIVNQLRMRGYEVSLVTGRGAPSEGDLKTKAEEEGIRVLAVSTLSNQAGRLGDLAALVQLYRLLKRERPAIVHLHMFKARVLGAIAARLAGVPAIAETLHGNVLRGYYGWVATRMILAAERLVGRHLAGAIIVPSEQQLSEIQEFRIGSEKKVVIQRYGFDVSRFMDLPRLRGQLRKELNIPCDAVVIGIVSRLVPIKGLNDCLTAVAQVAGSSKGSSVGVVVAGDGELREELEAYCKRLGIGSICRFLGWRSDLERIYADIDILVMSSLNEGTPVSLIEAMAAEKAIVATRVGGIPDMLEDGVSGLLVPARDPNALASAIKRLVEEPAIRQRLGKGARERALRDYSIPQLMDQIEQLYQGLLANPGPETSTRRSMK